jgi:uncharacterized membrane protein YoaK (UPF0700 family)
MAGTVMPERANGSLPAQSMAGSANAMLLLLTIVGAGVDAVMLVAFGVLTAAQTGNTVLLGVAIGQGHWSTGLAAGISVLGYVAGAGVGELIIEGSRTRPGPPLVARALVVELLLLAVVLVAWQRLGASSGPAGQDALVATAAIAMGIQSAVTLRLHAGPTTTYVTGTLTTFTIGLIRWLRWGAREPSPAPAQQGQASRAAADGKRPWMYGVTWTAYAAAAAVTALLAVHSRRAALLLPIGVLGILVLVTYVKRNAASPAAAQSATAADRSRFRP